MTTWQDGGRRLHVPIENVIVRDCEMRDGHGGVVIGSEISGGARNTFAEPCRMDSPRRSQPPEQARVPPARHSAQATLTSR
jgi:polygalacturonase